MASRFREGRFKQERGRFAKQDAGWQGVGGNASSPAPAFTTHPTGGLADASTGQITLTAEAVNASSYQWQSWNGSSWSNVTDETDTSLTVTPTTGAVYALLANGSVRSNAANVAPYPRLLTGYRVAASDGLSMGITGAYSVSRDIVDGWSSSRYTDAGGGVISAVADQSAGGGGSLTQATAGRRPSAATNNRLLIDFDGSDDVLIATGVASSVFGAAEGYAATSLIIDSKDWDDGTDPYDNDLIFADDGGNVALGYKSGPGSGSFTFLLTRWGDAEVHDALVVTDANAFQQIATAEYRADGATVGMRVGGATGTTSWSSASAAGDFDFGSNVLTIAGLDGSDGAQVRIYEMVFANALMSDTQQDALRAAMRAWATGSAGTPWAASLPGYGQPWDALIELDEAFTFCGISAEAQFGEANAAFARAFILSAANPDWLQAARFELRPEDDWNTTNRTEVEMATTQVANDGTIRLTGKFKIDSATGDDKALILQFHASSTPPENVDGTSAVLAFRYNWSTAGNLLVETQHSTTTPATDGQANTVHYNAACAKDTWHDYAIEWRPDPTGADALLNVWLNGTRIVNVTTAAGFSAADYYYLKVGAYNGAADGTNPFIIWHGALEADLSESAMNARIATPLNDPA